MVRQGTALLSRVQLASVVSSVLALPGGQAQAQEAVPPSGALSMEQRIDVLERQVREQQDEIAALKQMLARSSQANDTMLAMIQGRGLGGQVPMAPFPGALSFDGAGLAAQSAQAPLSGAAPVPGQPVGEAPAEEEANKVQARVQAVPEGQGVLTRAGTLQIEPSVEYSLSSTNRLVFRGTVLIPGINIGDIEASSASRETAVAAISLRYGLTRRMAIDLRVPWLYRHDRVAILQRQENSTLRGSNLQEKDIGDVEFGVRYQLNRPTTPQTPIFVAAVSVKSDTGRGPFDLPYDQGGVALGLATGSGFWAVSPSVNFLLPSDPVVIYGGAGYLFNIARDIDKLVGGTFIGRVNPGNAISANLGFGFALNPRFSFSLGYRHSYIFPTTTEIGGTIQRSDKLQVGSMQLGMAYRLSERTSLNFGFDFGVTEDAPDVSMSLRVPFSVDLHP